MQRRASRVDELPRVICQDIRTLLCPRVEFVPLPVLYTRTLGKVCPTYNTLPKIARVLVRMKFNTSQTRWETSCARMCTHYSAQYHG